MRLKVTRRQVANLAEAKKVACYLMWEYDEDAHRDYICMLLDYKHPTAVTHAVKKIKEVCSVDRHFRKMIIDLETEVERRIKKMRRDKKVSKRSELQLDLFTVTQ